MSLELHEILDRYELLYPEVSELSDLRRAVIDQDLSSVFRLCDENEELRKAVVDENIHSIFRIASEWEVSGHSDDLRRAIIENNLYSLFRLFSEEDETIQLYRTAIVNKNIRSIFKLVDNEDLRKLITEDNIYKLWPILGSYVDTQFTSAFKSFFINNIEYDKDCFSRGQLQSKQWLVTELGKLDIELGTVFLCAGWYATLATMLFESDIKVDKVRSFDIDPNVWRIAETFNKKWVLADWRFKSSTKDIMDINYELESYEVIRADETMCPLDDTPDTIINTSCEHIENFAEWYDKITADKLLVLQSNNFFKVNEHINCVNNIEEFKTQAPMSEVLYSGELELPKYKRFMLIGYK